MKKEEKKKETIWALPIFEPAKRTHDPIAAH
jgi:hypothetical protein